MFSLRNHSHTRYPPPISAIAAIIKSMKGTTMEEITMTWSKLVHLF
jgi:hypothetical protein